MCGITGKVWFDPSRPVSRDLLTRMTDVITHRGPDAAGYYVNGSVGLGHRRLSIIDLSTGDQPLGNEDDSVQVVFNGEIYNFADIRNILEARGHRFRTRTDTEVIVHGFEEWGDRCVDYFRGMFAFALWDNRRRILLLARDRLGVKPLYYALLPDGIVFGSEIKSLLEDPDVDRTWDPEALDAYLTLGYVPAPQTIYDAVRKLDAGHTLQIHGRTPQLRQYWDLRFPGEGDASREREYLDRTDELLHEAVRLRMISDVPLGAFLGGGLDSTLVVALMRAVSAAEVRTFTIGFEDGSQDEGAAAAAVARHLGTTHLSLTATEREAQAVVPLLPPIYDEPFADASQIPTYLVARLTRQHVTVALSGDGGDELFGGYVNYVRVAEIERWWRLPRAIRAAAAGPALLLPHGTRRRALEGLSAASTRRRSCPR